MCGDWRPAHSHSLPLAIRTGHWRMRARPFQADNSGMREARPESAWSRKLTATPARDQDHDISATARDVGSLAI
jgi:hypothetical protein